MTASPNVAPRQCHLGQKFRNAHGSLAGHSATNIVMGLLGTGPPDPTLESASPSPYQG